MTKVATRATLLRMKAVGIKNLKNQLSRYLKLVQEVEVVLVTDRDQVIAEIHQPTVRMASKNSEWDILMNQLHLKSKISLSKKQSDSSWIARLLKNPNPAATLTLSDWLSQDREDRF